MTSEPADTAVVISTRGLSKSYGPFKAVDGVDLDVREHDIHVFIGPNGAGKSTVLNLLGGQILPTSGEIYFQGKALGTTTPSWRARAGIGRSFQLTSIVPGFTCLENVVLAVQAHRGLFGLLRLRSRSQDVALAEELLQLVDLDLSRDVPAELLSHGQQRQLEIAAGGARRPAQARGWYGDGGHGGARRARGAHRGESRDGLRRGQEDCRGQRRRGVRRGRREARIFARAA